MKEVECSGVVLDMRGNPVPGAEVLCREQLYTLGEGRDRWGPAARTTSGEDGRFKMRLPVERKDYVYAFAWKKGYSLGWQMRFHLRLGEDWAVRLCEPTVLAGVVVDEKGSAIPGATVLPTLSSDWAGGTESPPDVPGLGPVLTDGQGRFRFGGIPVGATADFWVEGPGKASRWTFWGSAAGEGLQFRVARTDIRIVLRPEAIIRGRVVDKESGVGVEGIRLLVRWKSSYADSSCPPPVTSGTDGGFTYRQLEAKDYVRHALAPQDRAAEWVGRGVQVAAVEGQTAEVNIPVEKGGLILVTAKDSATDAPIQGIAVNVSQGATFGRNPWWDYTVRTDAAGLACLRAPAGECSLVLWGIGYDFFYDEQELAVIDGAVLSREVKLDAFPTATGVVHGPDARPAAGVLVASKPLCEEPVLTDNQGRFKVAWEPRSWIDKVMVLARDADRNLVGLAEVKDPRAAVDVTSVPAFSVRGRVTDPTGRGILRASVSLWAHVSSWTGSLTPAVWTDANGVYEIAGVVPPREGLAYSMDVHALGYGSARLSNLGCGDANDRWITVETVVLVPADRSISGVAVDANGIPAAGMPVFVADASGDGVGQPRHCVASDEQGRFAFDGVCPGPLRIQAGTPKGPRGAGLLEASGGDHDVRVVLGQRGVHSGLQSLVGKPLPDLKALGVQVEDANDRALLICLVDIQQRPSRQCLAELARKADALVAKDVRTIVVQMCNADPKQYDDWLKANQATFPIHTAEGDFEAKKAQWGVKALPWLILTDKERVVRAEGVTAAEIDEKLKVKE
jgi:hypothetical protein